MSLALTAFFLPGCESSGGGKAVDSSPQLEDPFDSGAGGRDSELPQYDWAGQPQDGGRGAAANAGDDEAYWTVVLGTFSAGDHASTARTFMMEVAAQTGMAGLAVRTTQSGSVVQTGRYADWSDPRAKADLDRIKTTHVSGQQMFHGAFLAPVAPKNRLGRFPQYHLSTAWKMFPNQDVLYTLQVGIYEAEDKTTIAEARRLCEDGARRLRADGEMAFYYHGLDQSTLAVGIFFANAIDPAINIYSAEVRALQKRFPHNALNGRQILETIRDPGGRARTLTQASVLVIVPRD